jgi:Xaa-Pro aminopeptidase
MNKFQHRLQSLQSLLPSISVDALLIDHPTDLFYLTGLEMSAGKLMITAEKTPLFVDGRYFEACKKQSPCEVILLDTQSFKNWFSNHLEIQSLGFDTSNTSYQAYEILKKTLPLLKITPVEAPVATLRVIKDSEEIADMERAAKLGCEGYQWIVNHLQEGVTEAELAWGVECFWREQGAKKVAFDPIIAFGSNSSMPHYRAGNTPLKKNSPVLIDIGVVWNHYHSDMTRTFLFGEVDPEIKKIHFIVKEAQRRALALCKPGTLIGQLDAAARDYINEQGYGEQFTHNLGHGVGLDIHETPSLKSVEPFRSMPLKAGMFITIEPGIYLPGKGGVRWEDTVLITQEGHKNFTKPFLE